MASPPHIVLFPFMSKGHTIPILHLARLLVHRSATVTVFTTPKNRSFIYNSLSDTNVSIVELPFPKNIDGVPDGIESTDMLPEISLWLPFAFATKLMQPHFEEVLKTLPPVSFMVTDGFFYWTLDSATKYGVPRFVYFGMSNFASTVSRLVGQSGIIRETESDDELFSVPHFPRVKVTRNDFDPIFADQKGPHFDFVMNCGIATSKSHGLLLNCFYELESDFIEYSNSHFQTKQWPVGPLCLAEPPKVRPQDYKKPPWIKWLDDKLEQGKLVLYVAFGSQAEISVEQFREIKNGLEKSEVNFLWVVRKNESELGDGFEERIKDRGLVVKEWVDQREILGHQSIKGFLSHCGWNSVIESICAKVPILAWPMMAEQPLNARMVVEMIKIGIRVETCNGSVRGFVKSENLVKSIKELMEGETGKEVRKRVKEVGEAATRAVQEGGSSWKTLNELLDEFREKNDTYSSNSCIGNSLAGEIL